MTPRRVTALTALIATGATALLLAGCASDSGAEDGSRGAGSTSSPSVDASASALAAPPYTVPGFPTYAEAPVLLETVSVGEDTAVVRHKYGEVEIPRRPERVYTDPAAFAVAAALDLPLAAVDYYPGSEVYPAFEEITEGVDAQSLDGEPDLERIAAAQPDLILAPQIAGEDRAVYDLLSQIAPTVVFDADSFSFWSRAIADLSAALDVDPDATAELAGFDAAVDEACADLQGVIGEETVQVVPMFGTTPYVEGPGQQTEGVGYVPAADTRWLYEYCELAPPAGFAEQLGGEQWLEVSTERLPEFYTADHLFVLFENEKDAADFGQIEDNPLWAELPAVRAGQVYTMKRLAASDPDSALYTIAEAYRATQTG